jgi:uncharacterized protein
MADVMQQLPSGAARQVPGVMWKTVADDCNLACDYCYYSSCGGRPGAERSRIDDALLDRTIRFYMARSRGSIGFAWQGGEPLLAGLAFFEKVVALQAHYAPPNTQIGNAVQTNGTLINEGWARFFKQYNFLVGVSIDGPQEIHDAHRVTATGKGSFDLVMRRIAHLRSHHVDFNILTVLHGDNVGKARELMAFYEREQFDYVQFIPGMDFRAQAPDTPPRYLITNAQYGGFLCQAFDVWYNDGAPRMSVRLFDDVLTVYAGREAGACKQQRTCSRTLVLEQNGDAYPCDFYMGLAHRLGNIGTDSLQAILEHAQYRQFLALKENLPQQCRTCRHLRLCHGGCPRNRTWRDDGRAATPDYFCAAYRQFFDYAHERLTLLGGKLRTRWLLDYAQTGQPWPERNAPCVCGSGKKFKRCCKLHYEVLTQSSRAKSAHRT